METTVQTAPKKKSTLIFLLPILLFAAFIASLTIGVIGAISVNNRQQYAFNAKENTVTLTDSGEYQIYTDNYNNAVLSFIFTDSQGNTIQSDIATHNSTYDQYRLVAKIQINKADTYAIKIISGNISTLYTYNYFMEQNQITDYFIYLFFSALVGAFFFISAIASLIAITVVHALRKSQEYGATMAFNPYNNYQYYYGQNNNYPPQYPPQQPPPPQNQQSQNPE